MFQCDSQALRAVCLYDYIVTNCPLLKFTDWAMSLVQGKWAIKGTFRIAAKGRLFVTVTGSVLNYLV